MVHLLSWEHIYYNHNWGGILITNPHILTISLRYKLGRYITIYVSRWWISDIQEHLNWITWTEKTLSIYTLYDKVGHKQLRSTQSYDLFHNTAILFGDFWSTNLRLYVVLIKFYKLYLRNFGNCQGKQRIRW